MEYNDKGQIVTFSGRVVDASDHLPIDNWAPEPEPKGTVNDKAPRIRAQLNDAAQQLDDGHVAPARLARVGLGEEPLEEAGDGRRPRPLASDGPLLAERARPERRCEERDESGGPDGGPVPPHKARRAVAPRPTPRLHGPVREVPLDVGGERLDGAVARFGFAPERPRHDGVQVAAEAPP